MESSNFGMSGQLGHSTRYGERPSLLMIMDDYIDNEDKNTFDKRVLDAMEKYVNMYNKVDYIPDNERIDQAEAKSATMLALNQFELQTGGAVEDDHRFSDGRATDYPVDPLGNIGKPGDGYSLDVYERTLVEDNVKNLHGLLTNEFNTNLSVEPKAGSYDFISNALGIPSSTSGQSIYFR